MNSYYPGAVVRIKGEFQNTDSLTYVDPGTITAKVKSPLGQTTIYQYGVDVGVIRDTQGKYSLALEPIIQGVWVYRWQGDGANKGSKEEFFQILESEFD